MIDYNIISTGSKGNAVVIDNTILIDCGVPFRALKDVYKNLKLVLLTHIHGDHFNRRTIKRLAEERPTLRFVCRPWMVSPLVECGVNPFKLDAMFENETICYPGELPAVQVFDLTHNVENCGFKITLPDNSTILYATDTNSMDGIVAKNLDLYMIEANYTESEIVERIKRKQEAGEYCHEWDVLKNHLSREKANDWLYRNMGVNSRYVYLHEHEERLKP